MSLSINFEPHSWYMGFAIKQTRTKGGNVGIRFQYTAFTDNGNTYRVDEISANKLDRLKQNIRDYHLRHHDGYGERYAKRRLEYLRGELRSGTMSYGEQAELQGLTDYIQSGDVELQEAAGVPEEKSW